MSNKKHQLAIFPTEHAHFGKFPYNALFYSVIHDTTPLENSPSYLTPTKNPTFTLHHVCPPTRRRFMGLAVASTASALRHAFVASWRH